MEVAVKIMLFQNTAALMAAASKDLGVKKGGKEDMARQLVLREAAVCCSVSHPNVVATYHFEVLQAAAFHEAPTGLSIMDKSGEKAFKLYLIQVGIMWAVCVYVCECACVPPSCRWVCVGLLLPAAPARVGLLLPAAPARFGLLLPAAPARVGLLLPAGLARVGLLLPRWAWVGLLLPAAPAQPVLSTPAREPDTACPSIGCCLPPPRPAHLGLV